MREITKRIRQSLELKTIFNTATEEIRKFLKVDRVGVFQFATHSNHQYGEFVSESIRVGFNSIVATKVTEHCFAEKHAVHYYNGKIQVIDDIYQAEMKESYRHLLERFEIRSNLVIALLSGSDLWGLLCIHQTQSINKYNATIFNKIIKIIESKTSALVNDYSLIFISRKDAKNGFFIL